MSGPIRHPGRLSELVAGYDNVLLDMDGTVWVGDEATPGAPEAIAALRAAGKQLAFVTNDGSRAPEEYVRKLWSIGCTASTHEIVSVGSAIQYTLAQRPPGAGVFVIGAEPIFTHVVDAGHRILNHSDRAESADVVVVVAHRDFNYMELLTATRAVLAGAEAISGGHDPNFPTVGGIAPGTGAVAAALEYATGRKVRSVGKPDPQVFTVACERTGPGRTLMVGDHLISDLQGAHRSGIDCAVVLTGVTDRARASAALDPAPVAIADNLGSLVLSS